LMLAPEDVSLPWRPDDTSALRDVKTRAG